MLEIKGCLVTIDAGGGQTHLVQQIVAWGADYVLAVKGNQPKLHEVVQRCFDEQLEDDCRSVACRRHESHKRGHGRVDDRYYYLAKLPKEFPEREKWAKLAAIGLAARMTTNARGKETSSIRYYITSRWMSGEKFASAVRGHWGIENSVHWLLDVTDGRRPVPAPHGPRRRPLRTPTTDLPQSAQERSQGEDRRQKQTTQSRL
jgi:predicted transposase YbfD/YdcC